MTAINFVLRILFATLSDTTPLNNVRTTFNNYKDQKQKESGGRDGLRICVDSQTGIKIDVGSEFTLDLSTVPQFIAAAVPLMNVLGNAVIDFGLILVYSLLVFAGGFVTFQRYDVCWHSLQLFGSEKISRANGNQPNVHIT